MTRRRSVTPSRRRFTWLVLLAVALFARALAPEGWMPVANAATGLAIVPCDGTQPYAKPAMSMAMSPGEKHQHVPGKGQPSSHPCAFAGMGIADAPPPPFAIVAPPAFCPDVPTRVAALIVPGRGLAAPPPPATEPPTLA